AVGRSGLATAYSLLLRPTCRFSLSSHVLEEDSGFLRQPWSNPMATNTVRLHRVLRAPAERVYRAFLDGDAMAKWLPPNGFTCKVHHLDARVGGTYKMSFTNFSNGQTHSFGGTYIELVPNERIRYTDSFDDPSLQGEMQATISFKPVSCGT